jgi:hypothetical protein
VAYLPPVVVEITGDTDGLVAAVAKAKAALDALKNSGGDIKIGSEIDTAGIAKAAAETRALDRAMTTTATGGGGRWTRWLALAHNILTVFGANIVADTIGIIAFGIGATAAFAPVVEAVGNLGQTYAYLNPLQQAATDRITAFIHSFQAANNAGIFSVFNGLMDMIGQSVGRSGGIIDQATHSFENFVAMLRQAFASAPWQQMFSRSSGVIQQDLDALFRLITAIINVIPALFHDFNGLGLAVLGGATAILHLITIIGDGNPALVRFAAMVFLVYRALNALGAFNSGSALRGMISGMMGAVRSGGLLANTFQSIKSYGLGTTALLLNGLTPALLGIVGAAALVTGAILYFNFATKESAGSVGNLITSLKAQDQATGNNLAGYQKLTQQLGAYVNGTRQLSAADREAVSTGATRIQAIEQLNQAYQQSQQQANVLRSNLQYLEQTYHLTQLGAYQLAKATGTDLTQAFAKGGGAAQQTRLKIAAYEQTIRAAQNPTSVLGYDLGLAANKALQLDDRVTALTNAFNALLTPFANVIHDTVVWMDGNNQLKGAVDKAHGSVNDMGNRLQRLAADDLATAINNTVKLSQDTLQSTGSYAKAMAAIQREIGVLQSLHSKSTEVTTAIKYLQEYLNALHSKSITLGFHIVTTGSMPSAYQQGSNGHAVGYASGTGSARPGWAWVGERGPELAYFRGGEKVIPHAQSMAVSRGYASGTGEPEPAPVIVYLDGQIIYKNVEQRVYGKNMQNGMRNARGGAQGRFGVR